ncbi:class I adenylate-forming enzyme family protein [Cumulibacter manganitolerans]|uniref:class I adenylate-forming enzyme family protein n=1 Tax=Cumulibacter manganitolerans TaxID=1884992 RepID=UPI001885B5C3|nr:AMP-binding protein [Cumulibacter manganitolerans]
MSPFQLLEWWSHLPERPFASYENPAGRVLKVTYAQQVERSLRAAAVLRQLGVHRGNRVHVHLPNCPEFLDLWLGANAIGAVLVPTNPLSSVDELRHFLTDSGASASIADDDLIDAVKEAIAPGIRVLSRSELTTKAAAVTPTHSAPALGTDLAAILYTSGTTSRPKGVLVTNANYLAVGTACAQHYSVGPDDRWLIVLPFFHANAQYYPTMSALRVGASIAVMPSFSATKYGAQVRRHRATLASLFAAPIRMILAQPESRHDKYSTLRTTMFAQAVTNDQAAKFERRFRTRLIHGYGMTETVIPPTLNPVGPERRPDSMGKLLPGVQVRIVGEDGSEVPDGEAGDLHVAGELGVTIAAGYWHNPEATEETFGGGWLRTGDVVRRDADGFFYFVDRSKDMIKRAGENVAAGEVERVVNEHPSVFECAAIGVADEMRDESIVVYVVIAEGHAFDGEALDAWCRERLAKFKVPSRFVQVAELPRTSVGKIRKTVLRELAARS